MVTEDTGVYLTQCNIIALSRRSTECEDERVQESYAPRESGNVNECMRLQLGRSIMQRVLEQVSEFPTRSR